MGTDETLVPNGNTLEGIDKLAKLSVLVPSQNFSDRFSSHLSRASTSVTASVSNEFGVGLGNFTLKGHCTMVPLLLHNHQEREPSKKGSEA
jgi:hypothetical protein